MSDGQFDDDSRPYEGEDVAGLLRRFEARRTPGGMTSHYEWTPASVDDLPPRLLGHTLAESGFRPAGFVDVRNAPVGAEIFFHGVSSNAAYIVRVGEGDRVTVWQLDHEAEPGSITGLTSSRDALFVFYSNNRNLLEADTYPGFLVTGGAGHIRPGVVMPYFSYDERGAVLQPSQYWMDQIQRLMIKEPPR